MFEFLTRRHAAPAETPLAEVRFTREDLFVLLGGSDTGMFANDEHTIDFGQIERHGLDPWRKDMAARLSPTGVVDSAGTPSDELSRALFPLNKPGIFVNNGSIPQRRGERDRRTVSLVIYEGHASALRLGGGRRGGFSIVPLPMDGGLDAAYRGLVMTPPLMHAAKCQRLYFGTDSAIGDKIAGGDTSWIRARCAERLADPELLCNFANRLSSDRSLRNSVRQFVSADYRGCVFDDSLGFSIPQANSPGFKKKNSLVYLSEGAALAEAVAIPAGGEELAEFVTVEFVGAGVLMDYLLEFNSYPEEMIDR